MLLFLAKVAAKPKIGKAGAIQEEIVIPAESDTRRLVEYVCGSNYYVEGEDVKVNKKFAAVPNVLI